MRDKAKEYHARALSALLQAAILTAALSASAVTKYYTEYITTNDYETAWYKGEKSAETSGFKGIEYTLDGERSNYYVSITNGSSSFRRYAFAKPLEIANGSVSQLTNKYVRICADDNPSWRRYCYSGYNVAGGYYTLPYGQYSSAGLEVQCLNNGWDTTPENGPGIVAWQDVHVDYLCTISFNAGDGADGSMPPQEIENVGALNANSFTKVGHSFSHWSSDMGHFLDGATIGSKDSPLQRDVSLTAVWTQNVYSVTFDPNGGTGGGVVLVRYGDHYPSLPEPTNNGKKFDGWYTDANGGKKIENSTVMDTAGDHVLYAHWSYVRCKVEFDGNAKGFDIEYDEKNYTVGTPYNDLPDISCPGLIFCGWWTEPKGGEHVTEESYVTGGLVLFAHWVPDPRFVVVFDANGGSTIGTNGQNTVYRSGEAYGSLPVAEREGFAFAGWWSSPSPEDRVQQLECTVATNELATLYARWKEIVDGETFTIELDDGSGSVDSVTRQAGSVCGELPVPVRGDGHVFKWWYDSNGVRVDSDTVVLSDLCLTARWSIQAFNDATGCDDLAFDTTSEAGAAKWSASGDEAQSGTLTPDSENDASNLDAYLPRPGTVSFNYRTVLNKGGIPGLASFSFAGDESAPEFYIKETVALGNGNVSAERKVRWRVENGWSDSGDNAAWIKDVVWTPDAAAQQLVEWAAMTNHSLSAATGGGAEWVVDMDDTSTVAMTNLPNARMAWLSVSTKNPGAGVLSFKWKTSCEAGYVDTNGVYQVCDYLEFFDERGGSQRLLLDGIQDDWTTVAWTNDVDSSHAFTWRYVKDGDVAVGDDAAWVKDVVWTPLAEETVVEYEYEEGGEVKHGSVAVPNSWADEYGLMAVSGKGDYLSALNAPSGKTGYGGVPLSYWADYVAGTVPTNPASVFRVTGFSVVDGVTVITWDPDRDDRQYTVWGKTNLTDAAWHTPTNSASRFFRVEVNIPKQ